MSTNKENAAAAGRVLAELRNQVPLVHCITNYVTVNDCANALLAVGGSPVMADDITEIDEIVSIASSLAINIGTLNKRTCASMRRAAKRAKGRGIPALLDPVGAGASRLRTDMARELTYSGNFACIRGNASEIISTLKARATSEGARTRGVDSVARVADDGVAEGAVENAMELARQTGTVVVVTGKTDVATDGERVFTVRNGHALMPRITGSGCMLSAVMAAYLAVGGKDSLLEAAVASLAHMGLAGEIAARDCGENETGTFRARLIDRLSTITPESLSEGALIERRI